MLDAGICNSSTRYANAASMSASVRAIPGRGSRHRRRVLRPIAHRFSHAPSRLYFSRLPSSSSLVLLVLDTSPSNIDPVAVSRSRSAVFVSSSLDWLPFITVLFLAALYVVGDDDDDVDDDDTMDSESQKSQSVCPVPCPVHSMT